MKEGDTCECGGNVSYDGGIYDEHHYSCDSCGQKWWGDEGDEIMDSNVKRCPACGSSMVYLDPKGKDVYTGEIIPILRCKRCIVDSDFPLNMLQAEVKFDEAHCPLLGKRGECIAISEEANCLIVCKGQKLAYPYCLIDNKRGQLHNKGIAWKKLSVKFVVDIINGVDTTEADIDSLRDSCDCIDVYYASRNPKGDTEIEDAYTLFNTKFSPVMISIEQSFGNGLKCKRCGKKYDMPEFLIDRFNKKKEGE